MINNKLNNILRFAYNSVPYYTDIFDKYGINLNDNFDFDNIPLLTKSDVRDNSNLLVSSLFNIQDMIIEKTSGSTGIPLIVYKTKRDKILQGYALWKRRKNMFGVDPTSKYCTFHLGNSVFNNGRRLGFSKLNLDENVYIGYSKAMIEHKPLWLFGEIRGWWDFANYMKKNKISPPASIRFIESTGEKMNENLKIDVEDFFQCKVVDNYGCIEAYGIAMSCENDHLHIIDDNVVVQIYKNGQVVSDGVEGDIVITSLNSYGMPFIKYNLGDVGYISSDVKCNCGIKSPIIKLRSSRVSELIYFNDGREPLCSYIFHVAIEKLNKLSNFKIYQFKVIQETYNKFTLLLHIEIYQYDIKFIKEKFLYEMKRFNMDTMNWNIQVVENISINNVTGKYQSFCSKIR